MKKKVKGWKRGAALMMSLLLAVQIPGERVCVTAENRGEAVDSVVTEDEAVSRNTVTEDAEQEIVQENILDASGNEVKVEFEADFVVDSRWEGAYNGRITLTNTSDAVIENWILSFETSDDLSGFYNGTAAAEGEGTYQVKNCGWNRDILPGGTVSFGFTGQYEEEICPPSEFKLLSVLQSAEAGADIKWSLASAWGDGYTGEMSITNIGETNIEDWRLTFAPGAELVDLWNATLTRKEENAYTVRSNSYNSELKPGKTVTFGFRTTGEMEEVPIPEILAFTQNTVKKEEVQPEMGIPEEELAQEFEALEIIYAENDNKYAVTQDVTLPATAVWGGKVTWESSDAGLVSPQGKVTRPEQSCGVTLTATIQQGTLTIQKEFELWILKQEVEAQRQQITQEELLEWNPEGEPELLSDDGGETLSYIYGRFTPERVETEQEAVNAVWGVAGWMGADEETDDFKVYRRISHEDGTVFRMSQYYKDVRVFGGDVIVSTGEEGYADYLAAGFIKGIEAETEPVLDSEGVVQILKEAYKDVQLLGSELLLYNDGEGYKPAWSLDVIIEGIAYDVLAEDGSGKIIRMENGEMYATPAGVCNADGSMTTSGVHLSDEDKENGDYAGYKGNYIAADLSRNIYVYDAQQSTTMEGHKVAQSDTESFSDDVVFYSLRNFAKAYDYYKNKHNWSSFDGNGRKIEVYANHRDEWCNAAYNDGQKVFKVGSGENGGFARGLDVIAHEFTHGVMHAIVPAKFSGLEAGAMNEAYADILGGLAEADAEGKEEWWIFGDSHAGYTGSRYLKDPSVNGHPSVCFGKYWYVSTNKENRSTYTHSNCTVIGHAAYQIQQDLGLTNDELARLWYGSMKYIVNSDKEEENTNYYERVRYAVVKAALDMHFSYDRITAVRRVFDQAGIPDERTAFAPNVDTVGYDRLIKGIVVEKDGTDDMSDNPVLRDYQVLVISNENTKAEYEKDGFLIKTNRKSELTIIIKKSGYKSETIDVIFEPGVMTYNLGYIGLELADISLECSVCDAFSAEKMEGIRLFLRKGNSIIDSKIVAQTKTGEDGRCAWENIRAGEYYIEVLDEREEEEPYEKQYYEVRISGNQEKEEKLILLNRPEYQREFNGNTYQLFGAVLTWEGAEQYCSSIGGHLVCIRDSQENDFLAGWLTEKGINYAAIGFTDREREGSWKWILDGEIALYKNWDDGEPNDGLGLYLHQNHAYMYSNGKWDDGNNRSLYPFFCEWEREEEEE